MAKQSGLGDNLLIGGYDLGCDIGSLSRIGGGPAVLDVTAICKSAFERIGGVRDGSMEFASYFNPSTDRSHNRLSALPYTDTLLTYLRGNGVGKPAASLWGKQINYDGTRAQDGAFTFAVSAQANGYGLEWGKQLTDGLEVVTSADTPVTIDNSASTAFGLQAYLQVTAFTGTDATFAIEHSSDDGGADPYAAVATFAQTTAAGTFQRIQTGRTTTIKRYTRVRLSTGTYTSATIAVMVRRNKSLVNF